MSSWETDHIAALKAIKRVNKIKDDGKKELERAYWLGYTIALAEWGVISLYERVKLMKILKADEDDPLIERLIYGDLCDEEDDF